MGSNYQTINANIFSTALDLVENKNYKELTPAGNYKKCSHLIINHIKKQFFFTTKGTKKHLENLLK